MPTAEEPVALGPVPFDLVYTPAVHEQASTMFQFVASTTEVTLGVALEPVDDSNGFAGGWRLRRLAIDLDGDGKYEVEAEAGIGDCTGADLGEAEVESTLAPVGHNLIGDMNIRKAAGTESASACALAPVGLDMLVSDFMQRSYVFGR